MTTSNSALHHQMMITITHNYISMVLTFSQSCAEPDRECPAKADCLVRNAEWPMHLLMAAMENVYISHRIKYASSGCVCVVHSVSYLLSSHHHGPPAQWPCHPCSQ